MPKGLDNYAFLPGPLRRAAPTTFMPELKRYGHAERIKMPLHLRVLGWTSLSLFCALFYAGPMMVPGSLALWFLGRRAEATAVLGAVVTSFLLPAREWKLARKLAQLWFPIFDFHHNVKEGAAATDVERGNTFIIAMHPHGIVPVQALLWAAYCDCYFEEMYGFGAAASMVQYIPFLRNIMGFLTAGPADFKSILKGLQGGKSLFILPGGVAEIFVAEPGKDTVVVRRSKGLMALASLTGSYLVPTFVFGGNDFFSQLATSEGLLERISRWFRGGITLFWGQWGLPIPFTPRVSLVMAAPIYVPRTPEGEKVPEEVLEKALEDYVASLRQLHERYKADAGYPERTLQVRYI